MAIMQKEKIKLMNGASRNDKLSFCEYEFEVRIWHQARNT